MTTSFVICVGCNHIRKLADMARDGKCIFCRRPHLASPPLPPGFQAHPAIKASESDAISDVLRRIGRMK